MTYARKHGIDTERRAVLRRMLEDRRQEIQAKLRSIRDTHPTLSGDVRDAEEQSVDDFVQDVDFALMEMKSETLRRIDDALHRVDRGAYGVCDECASEISEARLKAVPFATLCIRCQEQHESVAAVERETRSKAEREEMAAAVR